jgi:hypothetical protein
MRYLTKKVNEFIGPASGLNFIKKNFCGINYNTNVMRQEPSQVKHPQVLHSKVGSWLYLETLDWSGKACQGQTL